MHQKPVKTTKKRQIKELKVMVGLGESDGKRGFFLLLDNYTHFLEVASLENPLLKKKLASTKLSCQNLRKKEHSNMLKIRTKLIPQKKSQFI